MTIGIVGMGGMGRGIAEVTALAGFEVVLCKATPGALDKRSIAQSLDRQLKKGRITAQEMDAAISRLVLTNDLDMLGSCRIVIESIVEDCGVLDQLEGFEAPAGSWESEILPARIGDYDPAWLDALCVSGRLTWLRLSPPKISPEKTSSSSPVRSTPVVLLNRKNVPTWSKAFPARENGNQFSTNTQTVYDYL